MTTTIKTHTVFGYSRKNPCTLIRQVFICDEYEFGRLVLAWEKENDIIEWSKSTY